jgi:hypothetical protein
MATNAEITTDANLLPGRFDRIDRINYGSMASVSWGPTGAQPEMIENRLAGYQARPERNKRN